ncbi:MAG: hypothetical protein AB7O37_06635 [Vicinamibacteria bacterium]
MSGGSRRFLRIWAVAWGLATVATLAGAAFWVRGRLADEAAVSRAPADARPATLPAGPGPAALPAALPSTFAPPSPEGWALTGIEPARMRRGSSEAVVLRGSGLRADLETIVLHEGRAARGIGVARQELLAPDRLRATLVADAEAEPGEYVVALRDGVGAVSAGVAFQVLR